MKKWDRPQITRLVIGLGIGIIAGTIFGILFQKIGLFLPLGGIVGMCVAMIQSK